MGDTDSRSGLWSRFKSWFLGWQRGYFVPVGHAGWEWFIMRVLFAGLVWYTFQDFKPFTLGEMKRPTGIGRFIDLTFLSHQVEEGGKTIRPWENIIRWTVLASLVLYVTGFRLALLVSLTVLTLCSTMVRTLANSQTHTHHGYQIVTLTLLAQAMVIWYVYIWQWRNKRRFEPELHLGSYFIYYSQGLIAATYVLAAITKIINSKGLWLWNARYICIELIKSQRSMYYKGLPSKPGFDPALAGDVTVAVWMLKHPLLTTLMFGAGFFLEVVALIALRNRQWALAIGLSIIAMHQMIMVMMKLTFHNNEILVLIFMVNVPFWIVWACRAGWRNEGLTQARD